MTAITRIAMIPRDGLFCKDGRGWHTSASGRGHSLDWPWPSTVLGALRTAYGWEQESKLNQRFEGIQWIEQTRSLSLGRTLVLRRRYREEWGSRHRLWPVPADASYLEGQEHVYRLNPVPHAIATLGSDDDEAREALWIPHMVDARKPLAPPRWWSEQLMVAWLRGDRVTAKAEPETGCFNPTRRMQAHVGIDAETLTGRQGILFSHDVIETIEPDAEWAIGAELEISDGDTFTLSKETFSTLGADGRLIKMEEFSQEALDPPRALMEAFEKGVNGLRLVVVSPAYFEKGWLPDGFEPADTEYRGRLGPIDADLVLRAALVPRPVCVSGWDMAKGIPKPTARMVPPGAVYFFERGDQKTFNANDARALWLYAVGGRTTEGFGRIVPGIWQSVRN